MTRKAVVKLAEEAQIKMEERPFTVEETYNAEEAFITSATAIVIPVIKIDGKQIGDGKPGPISRQLRKLYFRMVLTDI